MRSIWLGFDPREASAFAVARSSLNRHLTQQIPVRGLVLSDLQRSGLYRRPMEWHRGVADKLIMWDVISDHAMSTQHANARFLVPHLAKTGWALFCDGDFLFRANVAREFEKLDSKFALYCVKHRFAPAVGVKMDGQLQSSYPRKNWSSFFFINCGHPANAALTLDVVNSVKGSELHRFFWLDDGLIGELSPEWNFLVGHHDPAKIEPKAVHFTEGVPDMPGYENVPFADEWRAELIAWAK